MRFCTDKKASSVSSRGLTTGSRKTIKNINIIDIFNWTPWSSHGVTWGWSTLI
ncbi:RPE4 domain protein [Rickettsia bellii str. RML An4]|uniref:RPE4 domain protein n=1 Tax=Rickettsia bellii str. RML An4 TaxID=1359193 RepID=A0A0F3QD81_RICBE|nr:RPE4 domain protein [Rickettsia bellii str. RML An4]